MLTIKKFVWCYIIIGAGSSLFAQPSQYVIPDFDSFTVERGESILIDGPESALVLQLTDGSIVVGKGKDAKWSYDGGHTWVEGSEGTQDKPSIDLGDGEVICIKRNSSRRTDNKLSLTQYRSKDNWKTFNKEKAILDIPQASFSITGGGDVVDGFLFHHGIIQLDDGTLVGTMYGNYEGDVLLCDGYPPELNQRKYRTVVVFSTDRGHTWGNHVLVAYDKMLGRGIPEDHQMVGKSIPIERAGPTSIVPAITQEGFREADIVEAPNGDLICMMRSGGRNGESVNLFPTPLYCSRSSDRGRTWSPPEQVADRGVCPNLVTMSNGIIVCSYSRPGNWLIFSEDNGKTWKGAFQFGDTRNYCYLVESAPDTIQVYHEVKADGGKKVYGTFFRVARK